MRKMDTIFSKNKFFYVDLQTYHGTWGHHNLGEGMSCGEVPLKLAYRCFYWLDRVCLIYSYIFCTAAFASCYYRYHIIVYKMCSATVYPFSVYIRFCQNKGFRPGMKAIVRFDEFVSTPAEFIGMYVTVVLVCNSRPSIGPKSLT